MKTKLVHREEKEEKNPKKKKEEDRWHLKQVSEIKNSALSRGDYI